MKFNDTSGKTGLVQECEFLLQLGDAGISSSTSLLKDFTRLMNKWYQRVGTWILESQDEWDFDDNNFTDYPIATGNLVASQQDYPIETTWLKVQRVEVTYDGSTWYKAEPFDIMERGSDTNNLSDFSKTEPYYDMRAGAIWLYPIPDANVTNGMKVWFQRETDSFLTTDTTKEPGFDENWHEILALGASYDYAKSRGLKQTGALLTDLAVLEQKLRTYYSNKQKDRNYSMGAGISDYK